ncbi:unnamed protein product, partial [Polarella glacialis]
MRRQRTNCPKQQQQQQQHHQQQQHEQRRQRTNCPAFDCSKGECVDPEVLLSQAPNPSAGVDSIRHRAHSVPFEVITILLGVVFLCGFALRHAIGFTAPHGVANSEAAGCSAASQGLVAMQCSGSNVMPPNGTLPGSLVAVASSTTSWTLSLDFAGLQVGVAYELCLDADGSGPLPVGDTGIKVFATSVASVLPATVPADAGQEMQVTCDGPCGNLSAHLAVTCQGTSGAAAQVPGESTRTMAVAAVEVAGAPSFATLLLDASSLRPGRYYQLCVDHGLGQTGASGQQIYVASVTGAMPKMIRADVGQALAFDCEVCSTRPDDSHVRLADGTALSGRLEIFHDGAWGSVCGRNFTDVEASVVCHQLGLVGGESLGASSASGSGPIWMSGVGCKGSETGLGQCSHAGWDVHNCSHTEDVAVLCSHTVDSPKMCCTSKSQVFLALASGPSCADAAVNSEAGGHARSDFVMMQGAGTAWTVSLEAGALSVGSYYSLCIDGDGSFGPLDPGAVDLIYITPLSQLGTVAIMKRTFQRMLIHCDSSCTTSTEVFLATHCDNSSAPALEQTAAAQLLGSGELWEATVDASSLTLGQTYRVCLDRDGASKSAFPVGDSGLLAYVSNVDSAPVALASKLQSATLTCEGCSSATDVYLTSGVCDGTVIPAVPRASLGAAGGSEWTVLLDGRSIKTGKHYRLCVDLDGENGTLLGGPSRFEVG